MGIIFSHFIMTPTFNKNDLRFIHWLKEILDEPRYITIKEGNTYQTLRESKAPADAIDYTTEMIEALTQDLLQGTHTYQYHIYNPNFAHTQEVADMILLSDSESHQISHYLKIRMLDLFQGSTELFHSLLNLAHRQKDSELMFEVLDTPMNYGNIENIGNHKDFSRLINFFDNLYDKPFVDKTVIEHCFIEHLKVSTYQITDTQLISVFTYLFTENNVAHFLNKMNIEKPQLCTDLKEKSYSSFKLNLSAMMMVNLEITSVIELANYLSHSDVSFPKFTVFPLKDKDEHLDVLIENNGLNSINEQKVMALFETLAQNKYEFHQDKNNGFKQFLSTVSSIDEKINLDNTISSFSSNQSSTKHKI